MLLQALVEHARTRTDLAPRMYEKLPIRWFIDIDNHGRLKRMVSASGELVGKKDRGKELEAPGALKTSGVLARLLADNGEYVLGISREGGVATKVKERHRAFIEAVGRCAIATKEPTVEAVLMFLEQGKPPKSALPDGFDPRDNLTFRVGPARILPIRLAGVQRYWATAGAPQDVRNLQCLVCAKQTPCLESLPFQVKGIPRGQVSGMALLSANAMAFESYGLERSLVSPVCLDCGELAIKALNALLADDNTHLNIGPVAYVFWTNEPSDLGMSAMMRNPDPAAVKALLESAWKGRTGSLKQDLTSFCAAALTANNARIAVRSWVRTTVAQAKQNLARYFALQRIAEPYGGDWKPLKLFALTASTIRDPGDLPARTAETVLRTALNGGPIPDWLLNQALQHCRADKDRKVTQPRAALIKMVLLSQDPTWEGGDEMFGLDEQRLDPAYLCGRLLAMLEALQYRAIPGIESSVVERFFGAASATPASVFPSLVRKAEAHKQKLRTTEPGTYHAFDQRIQEVLLGIQDFPRTLSLHEQGLFCLGYYHQKAHDRAQARERKEAKEAAKAAARA